MHSILRCTTTVAAISMLILSNTLLLAAPSGTTPTAEPHGYTAWMAGLLCGVLLTIASRIHWLELPNRALTWLRAQTARAGWMTLAVCYTCVLLFY